ncbi:hypothetical protein SAMN05421805_11889 [Saccharopolyspora antimicrobica]|uniref:Uncharacterized protein n=1 Tax=Saccharopolyspora antimicrobica TaxID=455193 RepID=A0A1I5IF03_9PSEU|nr:hypothetical protein [Saccharopolyspora antimicrobica]RKT85511.1 hypothetical protein ATL45_3858 [Saccharopolyspora antimicrobica]SFO58816.1 hypothetical protein SAMN05421805_11889 [Saccharopolyspora antimicrobica]
MNLSSAFKIALAHVPVILALAAIFWFDRRGARKLLTKWGVPEPPETQVRTALHYRRMRWACYPLLVPATMWITHLATGTDQYRLTSIPVAVLLAAALAELLALPMSKHIPTVRRPLFALVPKWGLVLCGFLLLAAVVTGILDLSAQQLATSVLTEADTSPLERATRPEIPITVPLLATAIILLAAAVVLWCSATRSFSPDHAVDLALRTRSARVALALAAVSQAVYVLPLAWWRVPLVANNRPTTDAVEWVRQLDGVVGTALLPLFLGALACWPLIAAPARNRS